MGERKLKTQSLDNLKTTFSPGSRYIVRIPGRINSFFSVFFFILIILVRACGAKRVKHISMGVD